MYGAASPFSVDWSSTDAGCPPSNSPRLALENLAGAVISEGASVCSVQLAIPAAIVSAQPSTTRALRAFAKLRGTIAAAGTDGGIWYVPYSGAPGTLGSAGEFVDGIAAETRSGLNNLERAHWATADRRVHSARYDFVSTGPMPFSSVSTANELLPGRSATTPVVAYDERLDGGSVLYVTRNGAVVAFDADSLRRTWTLEPGDAGIRGGRIDTEPIGFEYCDRHGGLLVPSSGDGSLYSFILDGPRFTWQLRSPWAMSGRTPENDQSDFLGRCTSD